MTYRTTTLAALTLVAGLALSLPIATFAHGMEGMKMSGDMEKQHEALEAKLADTSAFGQKGDPKQATRTIKVVGEEIRYDTKVLTAKVGETVTFQFTNKGEQPHEFTIGDQAYQDSAKQMMSMMSDMNMDMASPEHAAMHAAAGNTIIVKPGETKSISWKFTKPGSFVFACNFVGHSEAGMRGTITVK